MSALAVFMALGVSACGGSSGSQQPSNQETSAPTTAAASQPAPTSPPTPNPPAIPVPAPYPIEPQSGPVGPVGAPLSDYPHYMPVDTLLAPVLTINVLCDESIAAGDEVVAAGNKIPANGYSGGGVHLIYEAKNDQGDQCVYPFGPWSPKKGVGSNDWPSGSQFVWRSSEPGEQVKFQSDNQWASLNFNPGASDGQRYHMEVIDFDLDYTANVQPSGSIWFQHYPSASSGGLGTLVIRNSRVVGGKNALFAPSGSTMIYVEDSEIGRNVGEHYDQHHAIYINGILSAHFKDTLVFGQNGSIAASGHQLKVKSALRIFENVTLDNGGGRGKTSDRALADLSSFGWTWSENLHLIRRQPDGKRLGYVPLVDMRRDKYVGGDKMNVPYADASEWEMPVDPGECDLPWDDLYVHVFRSTAVKSVLEEDGVFMMSGVVDTKYDGIHPKSPYDDIAGNPRRNRACPSNGKH